MTPDTYRAIYDFALMPYALGDALTWNVHSAIRCEELGRSKVDVYICLDERSPANRYQQDFVTAANSPLLFNELFGAFGTQPRLGNLFFYRRRESMMEALRPLAESDPATREMAEEHARTIAAYKDELTLVGYFTRHAYSHEDINAFFRSRGRIPLLGPSLGCEPDVAGVMQRRFTGKRVVAIHMRLRQLDIGYGGANTYDRDSNFVEWLEFLREAHRRHPDVQFVALGRRQEKPLEMLSLPNVACLRSWGLGLGHELTLMRECELFMGTAAGFAAMAYFSETPYFITRMNPGACKAYDIEFGAPRFPFGGERQTLIYEPESRDLLLQLLERGLAAGRPPMSDRPGAGPRLDPVVDVRSWQWERSQWLHRGATSYRFFEHPEFVDKETAFLLWPRVKQARAAWRAGMGDHAWSVLERAEASFPRACRKFPEFLRLRRELAAARGDEAIVARCEASLSRLAAADPGLRGWSRRFKRLLARAYPAAMRLRYLWSRKHRIPAKLARFARQMTAR